MRRTVSLICVLTLTIACSKPAPAASSATSATPATPLQAASAQEPQPPAPAVKPVPAQLPDVIARVNGDAIGKAEFEKAVQVIEGQNGGGPAPPDQRDRVYRGVLDQIIEYKLLVQESKARKIAVVDADIDARIAQIRGQFPTEEAFKQALDQRKISVDQMRSDARSEMMVTKLLQAEVEGKVTAVKPEDVAAFYEKNPDKFQQGERVRASHILIRLPENADAAAKQQARAKAETLLKEVKAGKDFATLAKANSQDPGSAVNGGDLGFFEHGQMVGPFDQAAFTLTPGQTSEIVETQFGYHIIKVAEKLPAGKAPLTDEMRTKIQQYLENQMRQQQARTFVQALRAKSKVEIYV